MKNFLSNNKIRLQKYIADCGITSRRKAADIIADGRIIVNGEIIKEKSFKVDDNDNILFDNLKINPQNRKYIVLNKPPGYLCSHGDKWGRKTIYDIVQIEDLKLFSLGRLDYESSGLIILTNDGDFANEIIHPSKNLIKEYYVKSQTVIPDELIASFKKGIIIEGIKYKAVDLTRIDKKSVKIFLNEGKKREIRMVFNKYNVEIELLRRVAMGNLRLDKIKLKEGCFIEFSYDELLKNIY